MKFSLSIPTDREKFNQYAQIYKVFSGASWLCQVISSATTIGIVYAYFYPKLIEFLPIEFVYIAAIILAFIVSFSIEALSRICTQESVKSVLQKRFKGIGVFISILIILGAIAANLASGYISFEGGNNVGSSLISEPEIETTDKVDSIYLAEKKEIESQYRTDSTTLANSYQTKINAVPSANQKQINILSSKIRNADPIESKQWIISLKGQRKALQDETKAEQGALKIELSDKLGELLTTKTDALAQAKTDKKTDTKKIEGKNESEIEETNSKKEMAGLGVGWFTVIVLLLFIVCIVVKECIKHDCGMKDKVTVSSYYFSASIWSELKQVISNRINHFFRSIINYFDKAANPIVPKQQILFDVNSVPNVVKIDYQNTANQITLPSSFDASSMNAEQAAMQYVVAAEQLRGLNLKNEASQFDSMANQAICTILGNDAAEAQIVEFKGKISGFIQGKNDSPFKTQIGFKIGQNSQPKSPPKKEPKVEAKNSDNPMKLQEVKTDELSKIELKIMLYEGRVKEAQNKLSKLTQKAAIQKTKKALKNRQRNLQYWRNKKAEHQGKVVA